MKKILLLLLALSLQSVISAQIETPAPSPGAQLIQRVGLTDVSVNYSRPSMRDRVIFGNLVPFDRIWRTGANARTQITFSGEVSVAKEILAPGTYAIFTIPQQDKWEVILYSDYQGNGAPKVLDDDKVVARIITKVTQKDTTVETFTIGIDNISMNSFDLGISWENSHVSVPFSVPTDQAVMSSINKTMAGPSAADYYAAATYMMQDGKDIEQSKMYIDKAMSMLENPGFWQLRQQSLIYAAAGNKKEAIEIAKKSLEASIAAGNEDYIKMNKDSLAEWQ